MVNPPPLLFTIDRIKPGLLSTMAAPPGHEQLGVFLSALKDQDVDVVVSLLPTREEARLGLAREECLLKTAGIEFRRLPTQDFRAPELEAIEAMATDLAEFLSADQHVVIHCRGGVGRSSTLAAAVLVHEGLRPEEAWRRISVARGREVPETQSQRRLIAQLAPGSSAREAGSDRSGLT